MSDASIQDYENKYSKLLGGGTDQSSASINISDIGEGSPFIQAQPENGSVQAYENKYAKLMGGISGQVSGSMAQPAQQERQTSGFGAFLSGAVESALPSAAALAGGARLGAVAGSRFGLPGAVVGTLAGMLGGQKIASTVQDWAISKLSKDWQEALGQSEEQKEAYEKQHPIAHFIGGLVPMAVTMNPFTGAEKAATEGMTTFQKLAANPIASRLVSGTVMGGFEAGSEIVQGEHPDWAKIGASTAFGFVFNRANRLGELIEGKPSIHNAGTIAQANDLHIVGPGATEEVFAGQEARNPASADTARKFAQEEMSILGPRVESNIHEVARKIDPKTIEKYDDLQHQRTVLGDWLKEHEEAGTHETEEGQGVRQKLDEVDKQIEEIAPERAAIYQRAADHIGPEETTVLPQEAKQAEQSPEIMAKLSPPDRPLEVQRKAIQDDVTKNLIMSGRTAEESQAAAALYSAYYETKAARFNGKRGTAEDLYKEQAPAVRMKGEKPISPFTDASIKEKTTNEKIKVKDLIGNEKDPSLIWEKLKKNSPEPEEVEKTEGPYHHELEKNYKLDVGNIVRIEESGDLLVSSKNSEGDYNLVSKPDENGNSFLYRYIEGRGISRIDDGSFHDLTSKIYNQMPKEHVSLEDAEKAAGYISISPGKRSIITLLRNADESTFIHEMAHQWLEDLMNDARHPLAPDSLKDIGNETLKWLKVRDFSDIKRRQHEKWARGFEQYMREGVAPSPELASAFSKFKNWLMDIYKTLRQLGSPISPEIRGVFDRLLSQEPHRTVIAPEEPRQPTMADIHEDDANHVEPHPEAPHMDLMLSEAKQTVMDLPQEVKDEIEAKFQERLEAAKLTRQGEPGAAGPSELEHGGEQPRLIPESGGGVQANGEVARGGREGGAGISSEVSARAAESGRQGVNELAPNIPERFKPAPDSELDKAGNIVTKNLNTTEDIKNALKQFSNANGEYTELRDRRQLTEQEKLDIAGDLDLNVEKISMIHKMSQIVSENIVAARHLIKRTAADWIAARDQALASGTDEDLLKWHEATQRHNLVQGYLSGITANSGRALAYFRRKEMGFDYGNNLAEQAKGETGKTLFQLRQDLEMSKTVDSIQKVSKFSTESTKLQWGKMPLEFMVNNLISNPITHSTYAIGNEMLKFVQSVPEKLTAAAIGEIRRSLGRTGDVVHAGEALEYFKGQNIPGALKAAGEALVKGTPAELATEKLASDALQKIREHVGGVDKIASDVDVLNYLHETGPKQAFKDLGVELSPETMKRVEGLIRQTKENLVSMPGTELAQRPTFNEQTQWSDLRPDVLGMFKGVLDGFSTSAPLFSVQHSNLGYIPDIRVKGGNALPIGTLARLPSRMVSGIHTFFTATTYSIEKNAYAYRTAMNEQAAGKLPNGMTVEQRIADLRQNPPPDKMEEFHKAAYGTSLMGEPGELTKGMTKLLNTEIGGVRPLRFIAPFNQIFSNIARKTFLERTPLGILSTSIREDLLGRNGTVAQDIAQARMVVGSALGLAAGAMYYNGTLSGSGPADPIKNRQWREAGNQAHSIRIGDMWYDIGKLGPLGKLLSMGADLASSAHVIHEEGLKAGALHIAHAASQLFIEESPFGAMSNVMKAIEDPGKHGVNYASALISNFIPYSSALYQLERFGDPYSRKANTFMEGLMKKIPGFGEELLPRRDVWGEPIENLHALGYATSIHESQASNDPVRVFLGSAGFNVAMPPKQIVGVPLTEDQYDDFVRISGRTAKMQLDKIVNSRDWVRMPPEVKHQIFLEVIKGARNAARGEIVRAHPDIIQQAVANQKKLTQPAPPPQEEEE